MKAVTEAGEGASSSGGIEPPAKKTKGPPPAPKLSLHDTGPEKQKDAKKWLPPGAYMWRNNGGGVWEARLPPFKQHTRSWKKHTPEVAMRIVVAKRWEQYCAINGMKIDSVAMDGIGDYVGR